MKKKPKNKPLNLDWSTFLQQHHDEEDVDPPELLTIVKPSPKKPSSLAYIDRSDGTMDEMEIQNLTDQKLEEYIQRKTRTLEQVGTNCNDGGEKLRITIERLLNERKRRFLRRINKGDETLEKPKQCSSSATTGSDERKENSSLEIHSPPSAEDLTSTNEESKDCRTPNAFETEMAIMTGSNSQHKVNSKRKLSLRSCPYAGISSEQPAPQSRKAPSLCEKKHLFNRDLNSSCSSNKMKDDQVQRRHYNLRAKKVQLLFEAKWIFDTYLLNVFYPKNERDFKDGGYPLAPQLMLVFEILEKWLNSQNLSVCNIYELPSSRSSAVYTISHCVVHIDYILLKVLSSTDDLTVDFIIKQKNNVVLLDDEECQLMETPRESEKDAKCLEEARIYYPSREDRESVEICYSDLDCLAPEGFLTSPIMNFYILFLQRQASVTNSAICDYHFFNTYFYTKLQDAVLPKDNDKDTFAKFRKWWRNICLFQKAYILIPIHEDLHWSLAIICIPDKDDESGPIILHLDSLRLHRSKMVFKNIKRLLIHEWNYLNEEVAQVDLPIAESIWESLPKQIEEKTIAVPQQKNDCDCGLFVLYFMERFLEDAPERLRKKDLALFGKRWFEPEEASGLRAKIRDLLVEKFLDAIEST